MAAIMGGDIGNWQMECPQCNKTFSMKAPIVREIDTTSFLKKTTAADAPALLPEAQPGDRPLGCDPRPPANALHVGLEQEAALVEVSFTTKPLGAAAPFAQPFAEPYDHRATEPRPAARRAHPATQPASLTDHFLR